MNLFGCDETRTPSQGCTTLRTDLQLERIPGHMALCLAEMDRALSYRSLVPKEITIASRAMKGDYLKLTGEYMGQGMAAFLLEFESETEWYTHTVRAPNRKELRKALKQLYPQTKIGR